MLVNLPTSTVTKVFIKSISTYMFLLRCFKQFQTESYLKMTSTDQVNAKYSKADVTKRKSLDDMIKNI